MSPVHVRAETGDFAESVLLPGDPRRATVHSGELLRGRAKLVTEERGMLGYTGAYRGEPVSVQTTGMGCPSAARSLRNELIQLGVKNLSARSAPAAATIGTCGSGIWWSPPHRGSPQDGTVSSITRGVPYAPGGALRPGPCRPPRRGGMRARRTFMGPIVSSDLFYDPDGRPGGAL